MLSALADRPRLTVCSDRDATGPSAAAPSRQGAPEAAELPRKADCGQRNGILSAEDRVHCFANDTTLHIIDVEGSLACAQ